MIIKNGKQVIQYSIENFKNIKSITCSITQDKETEQYSNPHKVHQTKDKQLSTNRINNESNVNPRIRKGIIVGHLVQHQIVNHQ